MSQKKEFVLGMLIGSAVGAACALLYAPQGGSDTRELIRHKGSEAKEKVAGVATNVKQTVTEKADQIRSSTHDLVDRGKGFVETKKSQLTAAVDAGKEAYARKKDELQTEVADATDSALSGSSSTNGGKSGAV
jgi:gas vesicle protein